MQASKNTGLGRTVTQSRSRIQPIARGRSPAGRAAEHGQPA
jgi:hypothetical protein